MLELYQIYLLATFFGTITLAFVLYLNSRFTGKLWIIEALMYWMAVWFWSYIVLWAYLLKI